MTDEVERGPARGRRGFVLIAVLWLCALLAAAAAAFATVVRLHLKLGSNVAQISRAESVADGVVRLVALRLAEGGLQRSFNVESTPFACSWSAEWRVRLTVQDQAGLVDLNHASPELLAELIAALGRTRESAVRMAAAIVDFRDADDIPLVGGAERDDYMRARLPHGPKNDQFTTPEELDQVLGLEGEFARSVAELTTVSSGLPTPRENVAPAKIRTFLPQQGEDEGAAAISLGKSFRIRAEVMGWGVAFARSALITILRQPGRPFAVIEWRRVEPLWSEFPAEGLCLEQL
jgi:general secretion pathway protein K